MSETLEEIIKIAYEKLLERDKIRDKVFKKARRVRILSKQAIQYQHNDQLDKALNNLDESSKLIKQIMKYSKDHEELSFFDQIKSAKQEFAEASILYYINEKGLYPTPSSLNISNNDYLLGLADVPGELRRQTLILLQQNDIGKAKKCIEIMEEIYLHLTAMEEGSLLLKGMRRKMDLIRTVNEKTQAEINNALSRERLIKNVEELVKKLDLIRYKGNKT